MSVSALLARLSALTEAHKTTTTLITRLGRLPSSLGASSLNPGNDARTELSAEIHQRLKDADETLELLRQEVEDLDVGSVGGSKRRRSSAAIEGEGDRSRLQVGVRRAGEDLKLYGRRRLIPFNPHGTLFADSGCIRNSARTQFRKAQLSAKRATELSRQKERELLFAGASSGPANRRRGDEKLSQDDLLVAASSDVTAALRRTHQLMQSELSRSQFAHETLQQSTAALTTLSDSYSSLSSLLTSSRSLLSTLLRSQKSDTWYLESAFYILTATIIWLVFRRFLYGPLWWFVWLPLRLVWRTVAASVGLVVGAGGVISSQSDVRATTPAVSTGSLVEQASATGGFPRWGQQESGPRMSVRVGGGGRGAPMGAAQQQQQQAHTLTEEIGRMAERSADDRAQPEQQEHGTDQGERKEDSGGDERLRERRADEPSNPKKRMWEEDLEADKDAREAEGGKKDEL
ncbi:MAG: hypothetical protein M1833_002486 [Piccolia ochrophora]|nr:MAG: hypothetical protein M1833_002486 [Piccolia ochrophora]